MYYSLKKIGPTSASSGPPFGQRLKRKPLGLTGGHRMNDLQFFVGSVVLSFCAWGFICRVYLWPRLVHLTLSEATTPLLALHVFRFVGAAFMIPGVVSPSLPVAFAVPATYGDLVTVVLAWVALLLRRTRGFVLALWIFNTWGTLDLIFAFFQGLFGVDMEPSLFAAAFFIPTVYVPLLLCTHFIIFILLLRRSSPGRGGSDA